MYFYSESQRIQLDLALNCPIGITYTAIKVPELEAVAGTVAIGLLSSLLLKRRDRAISALK